MIDLREVLEAMRTHGTLKRAAEALRTTPESIRADWQRVKRQQEQLRYRKSPKGKAAIARYNRSLKHKTANQKYRATPRGAERSAVNNARRVFVGPVFHSRTATVEQAVSINRHVKERISAFTRQQTRAEA